MNDDVRSCVYYCSLWLLVSGIFVLLFAVCLLCAESSTCSLVQIFCFSVVSFVTYLALQASNLVFNESLTFLTWF